jgi:transposase
VEREQLEQWLGEGVSIEEIARRVGKHPSTVSYWVKKYGLRSQFAVRHTPRGAIPRDELVALIDRNLSVRQIAGELSRSAATVQYWLKRYDLATTPAARARRAGNPRVVALCPRHGETVHIVGGDGSRSCGRCRAAAVTRWRRRAKLTLVAEAGGRCCCCGYDRCVAALGFHHVDLSTKRFQIGGRGLARALHVLREEAAKCVLVCSNCHAEIEAGFRRLS